MKTKFIFFLLFTIFCIGLQQLKAQDDKLQSLLGQREQLILEYKYYNNQNSNFWGKKSKKDLIQIIESLKNIINKDSEIIQEINRLNLTQKAVINVERNKIKSQVVDDSRLTMENIYQLKEELASLQNLHKVKQRDINNLQEQVKLAQKKEQDAHKIIAICGLLLVILIVYIIFLRSKITSSKGKASRKKLI